jgi:hypothetical protein
MRKVLSFGVPVAKISSARESFLQTYIDLRALVLDRIFLHRW